MKALQNKVRKKEKHVEEVRTRLCKLVEDRDIRQILESVKHMTITVPDALLLLSDDGMTSFAGEHAEQKHPVSVTSDGQFQVFNPVEMWLCQNNEAPMFRVKGDWSVSVQYDCAVCALEIELRTMCTSEEPWMSGKISVLGHGERGRYVLFCDDVMRTERYRVEIGEGCYSSFTISGSEWDHSGWMGHIALVAV